MTGRQLLASAAAMVLGLLIASAGVSGATDLAVGALGLLLAGIFVIMLDVRRRQGDLMRRLRLMSQRQETDSGRIRRLPNNVKKDVRSTLKPRLKTMSETLDRSVGHVESVGEAMMAGLAQERLAGAERHVEAMDGLGRVDAAMGVVRADLGDLRDDVGRVGGDVGLARDAVVAKIDDTEQGAKRRQVMIREHVDRLGYEPVRQIQALLQLVDRVEPRAPLPPTGGWAMEPSTLLRLVGLAEATRPAVVVECGSGASTVWLAYTLQALGGGRIVALEHDERFAEQTRQLLDEHGLGAVAEVRSAPLADVKVGQETFAWYDTTAVADLENIDLLVVDGPPRASGPRARYPAVPVLWSKLAAGARIVVDDVDRAEEQEAAEAWLAQFDGLERDGEPVDRAALLVYRPA